MISRVALLLRQQLQGSRFQAVVARQLLYFPGDSAATVVNGIVPPAMGLGGGGGGGGACLSLPSVRCLSRKSRRGSGIDDLDQEIPDDKEPKFPSKKDKLDNFPFADDLKQDTHDVEDDVFGVDYQDGADRMGPSSELPPIYKRDATTGRMTGEIIQEMTEKEEQFLTLKPEEQEKLVTQRLGELLEVKGKDWPNDLGKLVRGSRIGLTTLGRSVEARKKQLETMGGPSQADKGFSQRLTPEEFEGFKTYMKKQHKRDITQDDIPVSDTLSTLSQAKTKASSSSSNDEPTLATKWMTNIAQREMDPSMNTDPYSELLPSDLGSARLVSRKHAKLIPRRLLHHNNVALLKYFTTPTGQIKHRIQTRLGAKDQRIIAKLIKRARHMGLMPYQAQFSVEQHGWVNAPDIHELRDWEKELEAKGLTIEKKPELDFTPEEWENPGRMIAPDTWRL